MNTESAQPVGAYPKTTYHKIAVDGVEVFYRQAGSPENPTVLLLHGFPTSSHMFRELIPALATNYHVIAPDYPGFGQSSAPDAAAFAYTFDHLAVDVRPSAFQKLAVVRRRDAACSKFNFAPGKIFKQSIFARKSFSRRSADFRSLVFNDRRNCLPPRFNNA